jgi:hypothetical protein
MLLHILLKNIEAKVFHNFLRIIHKKDWILFISVNFCTFVPIHWRNSLENLRFRSRNDFRPHVVFRSTPFLLNLSFLWFSQQTNLLISPNSDLLTFYCSFLLLLFQIHCTTQNHDFMRTFSYTFSTTTSTNCSTIVFDTVVLSSAGMDLARFEGRFQLFLLVLHKMAILQML